MMWWIVRESAWGMKDGASCSLRKVSMHCMGTKEMLVSLSAPDDGRTKSGTRLGEGRVGSKQRVRRQVFDLEQSAHDLTDSALSECDAHAHLSDDGLVKIPPPQRLGENRVWLLHRVLSHLRLGLTKAAQC